MNLVIATSFPFPNGKATANRVRVFAEELLQQSYIDEVSIISCSTVQNSSYLFDRNIKVKNVYCKEINKHNIFLRFMSELKTAYKLWRSVIEISPNVLIITIPSILLLFPIAFLPKKQFLILDIRDAVWTYFPQTFFYTLSKKVLIFVLKIALKKADVVCVTNAYEAKSIKLISKIEPIVVANGISSSKASELVKIPPKKQTQNLILSYIGNVGIAQELDSLLELAINYENILKVNIIGDGAKLEHLKYRCKNEEILSVKFHGFVLPEKIPAHINRSDILFAQIGKNFSSAIPTKVFEYIAAGRKILLGLPEGAAKEIFQNFKGVEIFEVGNQTNFNNAFMRLKNSSLTLQDKEFNQLYLKENFIREKTMQNLTNKLCNILTD